MSPSDSAGSKAAAALVAVMLLAALIPSTAAAAPANGTASKVRVNPDRVRFTFDQGETLKVGTRVRDVSGHGNYGIVRASGGGRLTVQKDGVRGRAAGFPRICATCGRAIISVASRPSLNARKQPFSFGASVRVNPKQAPAGRDPNIVMKGASLKGKWKLHLLGAKPRCVFAGAAAEVVLTSADRIDDGAWHRVVCSRNGKVHRLFVDGKLKDESTDTYSGLMTSTDPLKVGGRAVGPAGRNDQFHGHLDNVFMHVGTS